MLVSKLIKVIGATALTTAIGTQVAAAQDDMFRRDRIEGAGERYLAEYEPRDVRVGSFKLRPELGVNVESNSNVYAVEPRAATDTEEALSEASDIIVSVAPALNMTSDWSRHSLGASVSAKHNEYTDIGSESHTNFGGSLRGRIDVTREFNFTANAGAEKLTERRGIFGISEDQGSEPAEYEVASGGLEANWQRDAFRISAGVDVRDLSYDDINFNDETLNNGVFNDRSYRDYTQTRFNVRAGYAISPDVSFFVNTVASQRDYGTVLQDGVVRDAVGYRAQIGSNFQLSRLLRGEVAVGYLREERDDERFDDIDGLAVNADVQWLPTPLTTVSLGVDRYTADTGQIALPSALVSRGELGVVHELKRNILLNAGINVGVEEFDGSSVAVGYDQEFYDVGAGATYKLNPNAHLDFNLRYNNRDSSSESLGRSYDQTIVGVGLKLFP